MTNPVEEMNSLISNITDKVVIDKIAERAAKLYWRHGVPRTAAEIADEITMVHLRIIRLKLVDMLAAPDSDFSHDVGGIHRHLELDPDPHLGGSFLPRFADLDRNSSTLPDFLKERP